MGKHNKTPRTILLNTKPNSIKHRKNYTRSWFIYTKLSLLSLPIEIYCIQKFAITGADIY